VGDVEKKLSVKRKEANAAAVCRGFELHCFPDIASARLSSQRAADSGEELFQRLVPGTDSCICGPFESACDIDGTGREPSLEEVEQIAYQRGFCEGEQKGLAAGEKLGLRKGRSCVQPVIETLEKLLDELAQARKQTYERIESEIVGLAMAIARKIVGQELSTSPQIVVNVIRQAQRHLESAGSICIKLNPQDLEMLDREIPQLGSDLSNSGDLSFAGEASIARGGCVIETDAGNIDARLETQFKAIEECFRAARSNDLTEG